MSGHKLIVTITEGYGPALSATCHEPESAACRLRCPEDCESWIIGDHKHELVSGPCLAVEWWKADGMADTFMGGNNTHLSDGMSIEAHWELDFWGWTVD